MLFRSGLPEPEFLEIGDTFRVNLYRLDKSKTDKKPINKADKKPINKADKKPINKADKKLVIRERQQKIIKYVEQHGEITNREARELLGLADSTTKRILKQMVEEKLLKEQGERRMRIYKMRL